MIESRAAQPRRRYRRRREADLDMEGDVDLDLMSDSITRQQACIEALERGFVQSYVDLFYLTHRPNPEAETSESATDIVVSPHDMVFIRDNLSRAEEARRAGAAAGGEKTVFESYSHLAQHFYAKEDSEAATAVYFFDKCAEVAAASGDSTQQMDAARNLGLSHERLGDVERAILFHEDHLAVAARVSNHTEVEAANTALVRVYSKAADALVAGDDSSPNLSDVVRLRRKQLEAATAAGDVALQGKACHALGKALVADDETDEALTLLERHLTICDELDDDDGTAEAHAAMAAAHTRRGEMAAAVVSLELLLEVSQRTGNREAHASACAELGSISTSREDYAAAMEYFEQNFEIVRQLQASGVGSQQLLNTARVLLGTAKANLRVQSQLVAVQDNLPALLRWKGSRTEILGTLTLEETKAAARWGATPRSGGRSPHGSRSPRERSSRTSPTE